LFRLDADLAVTEDRLLGDHETIKAAMEATAHQAG
jgi:hypothetical protein